MKSRSTSSGFTLIEFLITVGLMGLVIFTVSKFTPFVLQYFHQSQAKTTLNDEARVTLDTIIRLLRNGLASSVVIDTPTAASPPNSRIAFRTTDGAAQVIEWVAPKQVEVRRTPAGGAETTSVIGRNVTGLLFTMDYRDPSIIQVTLRLDVAYDQSSRKDRVFSVVLPSQQVRMVGVQ
jgi:Tfp pilus assembly protein PilW